MNDQDIVALYFARDEQAIRETDVKYGKACMQVSMNILDSRPDAEECVNDTYLKTWNSIPPTKPGSLCAFICRIARNLSLNRLRDLHREKRNRELTLSLDELEACIPAAIEDANHLADLLNDFLEGLDETNRVIFMGRYWYSYAIDDLATQMGLTQKAVYMRLHKTRERLRAYLGERGYRV
ncbi:MAG: sigma-70 family RNA polymerase sigma factor [Clostridia bacterium]|nr:sigma-70 family RNA polymerase sigma factor [Clostridia bacterium]